MPNNRPESSNGLSSFNQKVLSATGIIISIILILLLLGVAFNVVLLILAGTLVAIFFRGIAGWLHRKTSIPFNICLAIAVIGIFGISVGFGFLVAPSVSEQAQQLSQQIPATIDTLKQQYGDTQWGQDILNNISTIGERLFERQGEWAKNIFGALSTIFGVLADIYVIFFIGIFFMVDPKPYKKAIVSLVPLPGRDRARAVIQTLAKNLEKWLIGRIIGMLVIGSLTTISLWIMGVPLALVLGIIAGLLNFIPNFGPLIAMAPGIMMGFTISPQMALYVVLLYLGIQALESNLITPMIEKSMVNIPLAGVLIAQLLLGVFSNALGLMLATPVLLISIVLIRELYVEEVIEDQSDNSPKAENE